MGARRKVRVVGWIALFFAVATPSRAEDVWSLQNKAHEALERKDRAAAERLLRQSIARGDKQGYNNQPCSVEDLALLLANENRLKEAEQLFHKAETVYNRESPNDSFRVYFYTRYADFLLNQRRFADAAEVLGREMALWRRNPKDYPGGDASICLSEELNTVARWSVRQKQFALAVRFANDAVYVTQTMEGAEHAEIFLADNLSALAIASIMAGDAKKAEQAVAQSMEILKKLHFERQDLEMAELLRTRSIILQRLRKTAESGPLAAEVRQYWPDYVWEDPAWLQSAKAGSLQMSEHDGWGAYRDRTALEEAQKSLRIASKFSPSDVRVAESNYRVAQLSFRHRAAQDDSYLTAALQAARTSRGNKHPYVAYMLVGQAQLVVGSKREDCYCLLNEAIDVLTSTAPALGKKEAAVVTKQVIAILRNSLARSAYQPVAVKVYGRACNLLKSFAGGVDEDYMDALSDLAHWQEEIRDRVAADATYQKLLSAEKIAYGADSPEVKDTKRKIERLHGNFAR